MNKNCLNTIDDIVKNRLDCEKIKIFNKLYYGREKLHEIQLEEETLLACLKNNIDVKGYGFDAAIEETRPPRLVKLGLIQHSIVLATEKPVEEQRDAILKKVENIINIASKEGVQILCLQESWSMPFFLCTKEKENWSYFAESATDGPSISFLSNLSKKHKMVIVSPILEKDDNGIWWNTAVVIDADGSVLGKHRKNHLPSTGSFSEALYYSPGDTGHPVFQTKYGKIAVNICYGRHHALNWLMFGLNGAEIVFNPAATISEFGESFWFVEARNAAIANNYYTCSINRVGTEVFNLTRNDGVKQVSRTYYGSSYISAPDGARTPCLSKNKDGLMIGLVDLNLCRQMKDRWGFRSTGRLELYAKELQSNAV